MVEKFEVTDWDLENEFGDGNYRGRKQTKSQAIYGIWADSSGEEDEGVGPSVPRKKRKDYAAPINFVYAGVKAGSGEPSKSGDQQSQGKDEQDMEQVEGDSGDEDSAKQYYSELTASFKTKKGQSTTQREHRFAGIRQSSSAASSSKMASWETHTKGIGSKLLMKMGYKPGQGLGKEGQGITAPIEAKLRKGNATIGYYGPEHKTAPATDDKSEKEIVKQVKKQAKERQASRKTQVKYILKSVDDYMDPYSTGASSTVNQTSVKIIDMTGPEQRVLASYDEIHRTHPHDDTQEQAPQAMVVDDALNETENSMKMIEDDILTCNQKLRKEKETEESLREEHKRLADQLREERKEYRILETLDHEMEIMEEKIKSGSLDMEDVVKFVENVRKNYHDLYKFLGLGDLIVTMGLPIIKKQMDDWDAFKEKNKHVLTFTKLYKALEGFDDNYYDIIVWEVWMNHFRRCFLQWPSMKQCDELVSFLEEWRPLLPIWIMDNILDQLVIPRLEKEVQEWDPLSDPLPIHSWIHPWLPLTGGGKQFDNIYSTIRHKIGVALNAWHPGDISAKLILKPWKDVFSPSSFEAFLRTHILPKLETCLLNMEINPQNQQLDHWNWVNAWSDLMPAAMIVSILEKNFLPRWLQTLHHWLSSGSANFDQVTQWYSGWKGLLTPYMEHKAVENAVMLALDMMNQAVTSPQTFSSFSLPHLTTVPNQIPPAQPSHPRVVRESVQVSVTIQGSSMNFKEMLEKKAEENGLLFMPIPNRYHESKQIYRFGKEVIYLDQGVIFAMRNNGWGPVSLQSLLDSAMS